MQNINKNIPSNLGFKKKKNAYSKGALICANPFQNTFHFSEE